MKIGVSAGPLADVLKLTNEIAKKKGIEVRLVEFTDWITPNEAVNSGDLDANFFQHAAFLATQSAHRGFRLVQVDKAGVIVPVGLFSRKIKSLDEIKEGDRVAISNDTINGGRALLLLERAGLIKLKPGIGLRATPLDVVDNPKRLRFVELDAAQIYRSLDDVTVGMVNLTFLIPAGGDPRSALIVDRTVEDQLVLRFVSRPENKDDPRLRSYVDVFKSPEVKSYIEAKLPAFIAAF
ncbi:MetQ/NlpA family ABC transporter substrate-binding protein [Enterovirga rhinocerotis]|uniref:MetQ/NlpA family ABC transporter substrate-binding protein n=1 Tax=Enterovirga rhinocerotis TaxID=1339210 RepID=UPI001FE0985E|nr:MetQ/NlpA family ABC transporter substrate-binding protein [Enterovirga rhinocerotis]